MDTTTLMISCVEWGVMSDENASTQTRGFSARTILVNALKLLAFIAGASTVVFVLLSYDFGHERALRETWNLFRLAVAGWALGVAAILILYYSHRSSKSRESHDSNEVPETDEPREWGDEN